MMLAVALIASIIVLATHAPRLRAEPQRNMWFFTAKEIDVAYRYQLSFGNGLKQRLKADACMYGAEDFVAKYYGTRHRLPCKFINDTLRHLKEILQVGAARYFFSLDLNHAHLAIPKTVWRDEYKDLPTSMILPAMLRDPRLAALYHSAEHLQIVDSPGGVVSPALRAWRDKRNILGFYDGRPIKILTPLPGGTGVSVPNAYWSYGGFEFLASHSSHLPVILDESSVAVDIKLDIGGEEIDAMVEEVITDP